MSTNTFTSEPLASQGQQTSAQSIPVVIASDQSTIPISGTITVTEASIGPTGSAVPASANYVAGKNAGNLVGLAVDSSGNIVVSSIVAALPAGSNAIGTVTVGNASLAVTGTFWQATQPVSGTVTANAGTNLNTSALALDTSVNGLLLSQGSTTSGQKGTLHLGAVTTSAPSYTTAQTSPLSLTAAGALRVDGSGVTQPVSGTVTATNAANGSNGGSAPGTATQIGGNNSGNLIALSVDGSGRINVGAINLALPAGTNLLGKVGIDQTTPGTTNLVAAGQNGTWTVQPGNTANTTPWLATIAQGGNSATVSAGGALKVDGSAATQPVSGTVTANAGTNLNTSALALDTSVNGLLLSQGSTTSGQKGALHMGAVTTSAPSYTTAQTSPLSLTTAGALRTDASATTQPVSGTVTVSGTARAGVTTVYNAYGTTSVTTAAYVQLIASTASAINRVYISDTSGSGFYIATGAAASEVNQLLFGPGGMDGAYELNIASGTRVSIKAVDTNATSGALYATFLA